jgi:NAD(P)-dependent dehydrogenase (short-subunit alcohol dehydrogenase family)
MSTGRIAGKVAFVTGAASGIGRAISIRFGVEGATVVAADVAETEAELPCGTKGTLLPIHCDVSDERSVESALAAVRAGHGRLDVLCNSAAIAPSSGPLIRLDVATFERVMAVNVRGTFLTMKHAIPLMLESGGGSIINLASIASFVASGRSTAYTTSKGAVMALTRAAAVEYAAESIRVNAICPGTVETPLNAGLDPALKQRYESLHPIGRFGRPEEIAAMALFLASDECTFATGAAFMVDGGRTAT